VGSGDLTARGRRGRSLPLCLASAPVIVTVAVASVVLGGCGSAARVPADSGLPADLVAQARPIGRGANFHPPARGPVLGRCRPDLGHRTGVHVELFAANRVVLVAAGIGTRPPLATSGGRIFKARCYGDLVTLEPTGVVQVRTGAALRLSALFRSWGQPLSRTRLGPFTARPGARVEVFVNGRSWRAAPQDVPLEAHSEIVLELGPHVPPHRSYTFPPGV
jgi:hypothetical protein